MMSKEMKEHFANWSSEVGGSAGLISSSGSLSVLFILVMWKLVFGSGYWSHSMSQSEAYTGSSILESEVGKISSWSQYKGSISKYLALNLWILSVGLMGMLPYSSQTLTQFGILAVLIWSFWVGVVSSSVMTRGSLVCVETILSMPNMGLVVLMALIESLSMLLVAVVMPLRMGANMSIGALGLTIIAMGSSVYPLMVGILLGFFMYEMAVLGIQSHVISLLFNDIMSKMGFNSR